MKDKLLRYLAWYKDTQHIAPTYTEMGKHLGVSGTKARNLCYELEVEGKVRIFKDIQRGVFPK